MRKKYLGFNTAFIEQLLQIHERCELNKNVIAHKCYGKLAVSRVYT